MSTHFADTLKPSDSLPGKVGAKTGDTDADPATTWHPLPLSYILERHGLARLNTVALLASWIAIFIGCLSYVHASVPVDWGIMHPAQSGIHFLKILYPPLLICSLMVFWFGFEWGFIPAYLSVFVAALSSGMVYYWAILLSLSVVLGLSIPALVYFSVPVAYNLRSIKSLALFVGTALIGSMASSMGAFLWSHAHGLSIEHTVMIWKGWWLGSFVLTVFVVAPLLFILSRGVENLKTTFFDVPSRPDLSLKWIYGSIVTVVTVLSLFTLATQVLGNMRMEEELAMLPNVAKSDIIGATETYHYASWIALFLSISAGLGGIALVANWNRSLKHQIQARALELQLSEQRFRATFEQAAVAMAHIDESGYLLRVNHKLSDMMGYDAGELLHRPSKGHTLANSKLIDSYPFQQMMNGEIEEYERQKRILRKDGTPIWLNITMSRAEMHQPEETTAVAVIEDITEQKNMEHELLKEKTFSDSLVNSLPGVFYLIDDDCNLIRWNNNLETITGYSSDEIAGMKPLDFVKKGDGDPAPEDLLGSFESGIRTDELTLQTSEGNEIPFYFTGLSFQAHDRDYMVGVGIDISELKNYENRITDNLREKETLLAEIHHRVKNNLAVITGLLELQKFNTDDEGAQLVLQDSQSRIYSMALVHEMLYQSESFNDINIDAYLDELIGRIRNSLSDYHDPGIEVDVQAEHVPLPITQAVPLGLLLNEMLTNAFKHAFKGLKNGKVSINIEAFDPEIHVTVSDNGHGFPDHYDPDDTESLGMTLINRLVKQLQGELSINSNGGVTYQLTFTRNRTETPDSSLQEF